MCVYNVKKSNFPYLFSHKKRQFADLTSIRNFCLGILKTLIRSLMLNRLRSFKYVSCKYGAVFLAYSTARYDRLFDF